MKKTLKNLYRSYFSLSRGERTGFLVLVGLIVLITIIPFFEIKTTKETINFDSFDSLVNKLNNNSKKEKYEQITKSETIRFEFNPNTIEEAGLLELGFTSYIAKKDS